MSSATFELKSEIVRAGAGAGKTTELTARVLEVAQKFYEQNNRLPKIIVSTFTRKATEELRERLLKNSVESKNSKLIDFVTSQSQLHVTTLHGVLSLFLRRYGHLLDFDSNFTVLDASASDRLHRKVLRDVLINQPEYEIFLEHYTFDKLSVVVQAAADELAQNPKLATFSFEEVGNLTSARIRANFENLNKIAKAISSSTQDEKWQQYARFLTKMAQASLELTDNAFADWMAGLKEIKTPSFLSKKPPFEQSLNEELKIVKSEIESLLVSENTKENIEVSCNLSALLLKLSSEYQAKLYSVKFQRGQIEMRDLELLTRQFITDHPEVAAAFTTEWDYWLIDEFQDTSPLQISILSQLIGKTPAYYVGDPQQSIYLFRGARAEVFHQELESVKAAGGRVRELKKNYRSRPELLMFFNDFFGQLNSGFLPMDPHEDKFDDQTVVAKFKCLSKEVEDPYATLASEVVNAVQGGARLEDFCVLARTNKELQDLAIYFEEQGIPTHIHASAGFYRRREILDLLSFVKFLLNSHDNLNFVRLARSPWFLISDQKIADIVSTRPIFYWQHFQKNCDGDESVMALTKYLGLKNQIGIFETVRRLITDSGIIDTARVHDSSGRRESNIWKFLQILNDFESSPGFSYTNFIKRVFDGFKSVEGDEESDAVAALEPSRVNFMTIHKSKGLKFKRVILPNMQRRPKLSTERMHDEPFIVDEDDAKFALAIQVGEERKLKHNLFGKSSFQKLALKESEEYMRLLYVALTRASEQVILHWQDPVASTSWPAHIHIDLSQGLHSTEYYSYLVECDPEVVSTRFVQAATDASVRGKWQEQTQELIEQRRISVSALIEEKYASISKPFEVKTPEDATKLKSITEKPVFGLKLHTWFERVKYNADLDLNHYALKWFSPHEKKFIRAVNYTLNLTQPPVRELIARGEVESGFQIQTDRGVMEGQIDLWGVDSEGCAWVIDYKSGSASHIEKAFDQLNLYSLAIRAQGFQGKIKLAVIYSLEEKVQIREANSESHIRQQFEL